MSTDAVDALAMVAGSRPLILGLDLARLRDLVALELWHEHRTPHLLVIDEVAPWPTPRNPGGDAPETVTIRKGQSVGKSEAPVSLILHSSALGELEAVKAAAGAAMQREIERQTVEAILGRDPMTPKEYRRTMLLDWPLTDPREEAARREREARAQERKANFRHPEGPCSYRATGSKRSRRRNQGRGQ